jgi:hypothetical protein
VHLKSRQWADLSILFAVPALLIGRTTPIEVSVLNDKSKRKRKVKKKDSQLVVRINRDERDAFIDICDELDTSAAREVRGFIRDFLQKHPSEDD